MEEGEELGDCSGGGGGRGDEHASEPHEYGHSLVCASKLAWMRALLQSLREEAPSNIQRMEVTAATFHDEMSWSKEEAPSNMPLMVVTADTFQAPMSWSKEEARYRTSCLWW